MSSKFARCHALCLSLGLTLLSQLPVVTAEHAQQSSKHPAAIQAVCTVSGISTIYDADEKLWKRWSVNQTGDHNQIMLSTSVDGDKWSNQNDPCFSASTAVEAWDHTSISGPVVLLNPDAAPDRKYMLWYAGSNSATTNGTALANTSIGLAFSADGRHFSRIAASESPCNSDGMVISPRAAFAGEDHIENGTIGEPRVSLAEGQFTMSFFRVGTNGDGVVQSAGLASATSNDGIKWTMQTDSPVTVQLVDTTKTTPALVQRLRQLVDAYSECPM